MNTFKILFLTLVPIWLVIACKKADSPSKEESKGSIILTFNTVGGTKVPQQEMSPGSIPVVPEDPDKNVWILDGWYKDENYLESFDFKIPLYKSDTIYAKWKSGFKTVSTLVGNNSGLIAPDPNKPSGPMTGYSDGIGTNVHFWGLSGITVDVQGALWVNEYRNRRVRKITMAGVATTIAGNGRDNSKDGLGTAAEFTGPGSAMAFDSKGNLYIMDSFRLKRISPSGLVTTIAGSGLPKQVDGTGTAASFWTASGMFCDLQDNIIISEFTGPLIRKVTPEGVVTTLSNGGYSYKDGPLATAGFQWIKGMCLGKDGTIYLADQMNHRIRKISPDGIVSTFAGNGKEEYKDGRATNASFAQPDRVAIDRYGNLYVTEPLFAGSRLRLISPEGHVVTIWAGSSGFKDGPITEARFDIARDVAIGKDDCIYVMDDYNSLVRKISQ